MRHYAIVLASVLAALAANIALDAYTDAHMLLRWAFAIVVGLFVTLVLSKWANARRRQGGSAPRNRS